MSELLWVSLHNYTMMLKCPDSGKHNRNCTWNLSRFCAASTFSSLWFELHYYNNIFTISLWLSSCLWTLLGNCWTWGNVRFASICSQLVRSGVCMGTPELPNGSEVEGCLSENCALGLWCLTQICVVGVRSLGIKPHYFFHFRSLFLNHS